MKISDFLNPVDVIIDARASQKQPLLQELARKAAANLGLQVDDVAAALWKREGLGSTGLGSGVAVPHARLTQVAQPHGILVRLKPPVEFNAIDSLPVDLVFLLLLPTAAESDQLGALALVARKLRTADARVQLRRAKTTSELYAAIIG